MTEETVTIDNLSLTQLQKLSTQAKGLHSQYSVLPKKSKKQMYAYSQPSSGPSPTVTVSWNTSNPLTQEQFVKQAESITNQKREDIDWHIALSTDIRHIRDVQFSTNIKSGVSDVLSRLELATERLSIFENMMKGLKTTDMSTVTKDVAQAFDHGKAQVTKEGAIESGFSVKTLVYPKEFLLEQIVKLKAEIRDLEAKRDELNSKVKVSIVLHTKTAKMLGL